MGVFGKKFDEAEASRGGVFWEPGKYLVYIEEVKLYESKTKGDMFIVAGINLESNNEERPVGSKPSWVVKLSQPSAFGNIKAFLAAAHNEPVEEITSDVAELDTMESNPLCGKLVRLEVTTIQTQKTKSDFSLHRWSAVPPEMQAKAEQLLAEVIL